MFARLSNYVSCRSALITTLILFLGAAPLPYATMMFSHALVVGLLAIAIWAVERSKKIKPDMFNSIPRRGISKFRRWFIYNRWSLLAGFACGWALASEYSSGLMVGEYFCGCS